jgi:hypothetical protein
MLGTGEQVSQTGMPGVQHPEQVTETNSVRLFAASTGKGVQAVAVGIDVAGTDGLQQIGQFRASLLRGSPLPDPCVQLVDLLTGLAQSDVMSCRWHSPGHP